MDNLSRSERADVMSVNDDPHDWYCPHKFHPDSSMQHPYNVDNYGKIVLKDVDFSTIQCPECVDVDAYKNEKSTPQCPECGMLCTAPEVPEHEIMRDAKGARRVDDEGNPIE